MYKKTIALFSLLFLLVVGPTVSYAANAKGWVKDRRGKGSEIPAPGIKLTPSTVPTNSKLADGVVYYNDASDIIYGRINGAWVNMGTQGGGSVSLDGAFDNGKIINGANSDANAVQMGDGTDALLIHTEGAGDVRITTNGTSDLIIIPDGGDTDITGTLDVSGATTTGALTAGGTLTVSTGGVVVSAGGVDIDAGGLTVAGGATIEDSGIAVTGGATLDAATVTGNITSVTGDLIISAGEIDVTGNTSNTDVVDLTRSNSASGGDLIDANMGTAVIGGDVLDAAWSGAGTGNVINANMTNNLEGSALDVTVAGVRIDAAIKVTSTSTGSDNIIGISLNGVSTSTAVNIDMNASVGALGIFINNGAGVRTGADIQVQADSTATHSVIDINASGSGAVTGFDFAGTYTGSPGGNALAVTFADATNLDTGILNINVGIGDRSSLIKYVSTGTDSGTTSHVIDLDQTGILDSNIIDITYDTGASTGQAIDINMATNVTGMAISVDSAATGVDNEGSALDINATGDLIAGANVFRIDSSGTMANASTRVVEINETGVDQANSYTAAITSTNNGGLIISSAATDHAIDVTQGIVDLNGNKIEFFDSAVGMYSQADTFLDIFADGGLRVGDSSAGAPTNYTNFAADGTLTFAGTARVSRTMYIPAAAFVAQQGSPVAGAVGYTYTLDFDADAAESVITTFTVPSDWYSNSNLEVYVHWSCGVTTNAVVWDGDWVPIAEGEDASGTGTSFSQVTDTTNGSANYLNKSSALSITLATIAADDQIMLRITRLGADGSDTVVGDAQFHGVNITYSADKL